MRIWFDSPKTHVGLYMGNGEDLDIIGVLAALILISIVLPAPIGPIADLPSAPDEAQAPRKPRERRAGGLHKPGRVRKLGRILCRFDK
jgi:hypothetical protein